jgi:hypothetical protein
LRAPRRAPRPTADTEALLETRVKAVADEGAVGEIADMGARLAFEASSGRTGGCLSERRIDWTKRARFEISRSQLGQRMRRICAEMPRETFERLIAQMARIELRYETVTSVPRHDGGPDLVGI